MVYAEELASNILEWVVALRSERFFHCFIFATFAAFLAATSPFATGAAASRTSVLAITCACHHILGCLDEGLYR